MFSYKGYLGRVEVDTDADIIYGTVINTQDVITFEGESVAEAKKAFEDSVDVYLEFCKDKGVEPDKPFSGQFVTRISPELHREASSISAAEKMSLNAWVESVIRKSVESVSTAGMAEMSKRRKAGAKPKKPTKKKATAKRRETYKDVRGIVKDSAKAKGRTSRAK